MAVWSNLPSDWQNYRLARNSFKSALDKAKNDFVNKKINSAKDQKEMWRTIKSLVLKKQKSTIKGVVFDNVLVNDCKAMSSKFNAFFVKSVSDLNRAIPVLPYVNLVQETNTIFKFKYITLSDLKSLLKNMKNKKDANMYVKCEHD